MANIFLGLALGCVGLFVVLSMMIVHEVSKRGVQINFFLLKLYIIKYIQQYRTLTEQETGHAGRLYYPCIASVNFALVFAILGLWLM